jgi:hypothetical protein
MRHPTATLDGDGPEIEAAATTDHTLIHQVRHWAMTHGLGACRVCTGFRIDELGLAHVFSLPDLDPSHRQSRTDGSGPWFASTGTWRR